MADRAYEASEARPYECRRCGKRYRKRRSLSRRGYCPTKCGPLAGVEANLEQIAGEGPTVDKWREGMIRALTGSRTLPPPATDDAAEG